MQAMGGKENEFVLHEGKHAFLKFELSFYVEVRSRFVEEQDGA